MGVLILWLIVAVSKMSCFVLYIDFLYRINHCYYTTNVPKNLLTEAKQNLANTNEKTVKKTENGENKNEKKKKFGVVESYPSICASYD